MNIEEILKSSHSSLVNGTPPCQNIMFPSPRLFISPFQKQQEEQWQQQNPYRHQPLIHIPTKSSTTTLGEVGASVDMLRAQLTELSKRMDAVEYNLSEFKNSVSNDIYLLKSTLSEHATELLNVRECVEDTRAHVEKTKELIERQDICVDNLADAVRQSNCLYKKQRHQKKIVASNVDLGMVRRRLSKVEDFTNEFYEQFESFKSVKEIIADLSDHVNECDQDISSFVVKRNQKVHCHVNENDVSNLNDYFSNYNSDHDDSNSNIDVDANNNNNKNSRNSVNYEITSLKSNEYNSKNEEQEEKQEQEFVIEDDDFEKL
jgi:hypothetical protein